ncbi:HXXEE domain-containing protein [Azospirillum sp.]|uniref:HXXEE domain-containing protein n=1 Tax=Azospirillum sp. TaxID=34012 RepID=UPI003D709C35
MSAIALPVPRLRFHRLIWLMPAAFAPHIVEEYGTGFPDWVTHTLGSSMTGGAFLLNNAVFMAILLSLTAWAAFRPSPLSAFVLLSWASGNLFWNFVFHLATTFLYDRFSPGLMTAVLLYFPISLAVAWTALGERVLSRAAFAGAVAIGGALMLVVIWAGLFQLAH